MSTSDAMITIVRARCRRLAKIVSADGTIQDYDKPYRFDLAEVLVTGLDELERLLRRLECRRDCAVVRGAVADPTRTKGVRRLLYRDGNDDPTLVDTPKKWAALDFDGLPRPDWIDLSDLPGCACVAIRKLPNEFRNSRCLVQATASHGLKPGIRIRLWYWLDRPTSGSELKYWLRSAPLDLSIFSAAQITYVAAPLFLAGAFDPLSKRLDTVSGAAEAIVPSPERLRPPAKLYSPRAAGPKTGFPVWSAPSQPPPPANGMRCSTGQRAECPKTPMSTRKERVPFLKMRPYVPALLSRRQPQRCAVRCAVEAGDAQHPARRPRGVAAPGAGKARA